jgi:TolB protein
MKGSEKSPLHAGLRRESRAWLLVLPMLVIAPWPAAAQVRGLISGPGQTAYPIALAALEGTPSGAAEARKFASTLARDLELSGFFRLVFANAPAGGGDGTDVDFARWRDAGTRLLVTGRFRVQGNELLLEARLFDVAEERQLGGKRYQGVSAEAARMANRFADEILELVTGERGPFDTRIAFLSTRGGRFKDVYVMSFDGGDLRALTSADTINLSPSWSPRGESLLFTSFREGRPGLFEIGIDSRAIRRVLRGRGSVVGGRYAPDGDAIAVSLEGTQGNTEIEIIDRSGERLRMLTRDPGIDVSPSWSPDGNQIAFCSSRGGSPQIYVVDLSSGRERRITYEGSYNTSPAWSPKGERIAYTGRVGRRFQVFVIDLAAGSVHQVTSSTGDNADPSWAPDGRYLLFSSTRSGRSELYMSDWRGLHQERLITGPGGDSSPTWSSWLEN